MEETSRAKMFGGWQVRYEHESEELKCRVPLSVYYPPAAEHGPVPVLYYLSGLTCNDQNFVTKAGAQRMAAECGLALVAPDTSPRDIPIPEASFSWDFGFGAGFYVDATQEPFCRNFRMYSYVVQELPTLLAKHQGQKLDTTRASIFGHSMGGHGALTLALKNPDRYRSVSAFAPICHPSACPWGLKAFSGYFGEDQTQKWAEYDATTLISHGAPGAAALDILIDQGSSDKFLTDGQLLPNKFVEACEAANVPLKYRLHEGYDHSYFFISTFVDDHIRHHAAHLLK